MEDKIKLITSDRTFGVEIEMGAKDPDSINKLYRANSNWLSLTSDSSVHAPNAVELVTNILSGSTGSKNIIKLCGDLEKNNIITDDITCGMHIHLDGKDFKNKSEVVYVNEDGISQFIKKHTGRIEHIASFEDGIAKKSSSISEKASYIKVFGSLKDWITDRSRDDQVRVIRNLSDGSKTIIQEWFNVDGITVSDFYLVDRFEREIEDVRLSKVMHMFGIEPDGNKARKMMADGNTAYRNAVKALRKESRKHIVASINSDEPYKRLRALMLFYTAFDDVFQAMVPASRRDGNSYCMPISDHFTLDQILSTKNYGDIEKLWYKVDTDERVRSRKNQHFDNSRYLDFNFHSLWNRHGTIEIRLHGSTKNARQILLWIALHQHILDSVSRGDVTCEAIIKSIEGASAVDSKCRAMFEVLSLPEHLQKYIIRLVSHFSDINVY